MDEEPLLPFQPSREGVPPLTAVRSTLLGSSVLSLRAHGLEPRYLAELAPEHREAMLYTPVGIWVPAATAEAHYAACDRLGLPEGEILLIGSKVARATQKSVLAGILRLAREAGTTPWTLYRSGDKYWARFFEGSGLGIFKLGPKEARVEVAGCSLCLSNYWRVGLRGLLAAMTEPFAQTVHVRELSPLASSTTCGFRIAWT